MPPLLKKDSPVRGNVNAVDNRVASQGGPLAVEGLSWSLYSSTITFITETLLVGETLCSPEKRRAEGSPPYVFCIVFLKLVVFL